MKIGYAKLGRSWNLDPAKWSVSGGDVDVRRALDLLSYWHPEHEFVLIGRNSGEDPSTVYMAPNVTNPWTELREQVSGLGKLSAAEVVEKLDRLTAPLFEDLDAIIVWAGQHGTSNTPIPPVGKTWQDEVTQPQISFVNYGSYLIRGINRWRDQDPLNREEIWLCPDPRNYIKCRDLKWPHRHPIQAQFAQVREQKHERYDDASEFLWWNRGIGVPQVKRCDDGHVWVSQTAYAYTALELTALPHPSKVGYVQKELDFGIVINENRKEVTNSRLKCMQEWVMPSFPDCEIRGVWSDGSKEKLGRPDIEPVPYSDLLQTMGRYRATLTTPASGSGWATAKPWEAFAVGTVCFFHPMYDTQGHIIPTLKQANNMRGDLAHLAKWLRLREPSDLPKRVEALKASEDAWLWLVRAQRKLFEDRWQEWRGGVIEIERRLGLT